ncbi:MAG: nitrilase-related carbon-nitrogen hydrolase [Sphingomonadales bacterium]|nr:nitrilase family protein [Sphingomonadales bacterium]
MQTLIIRAIQMDILWENPVGNIEKLSEILDTAKAGELVVLPEMFATGFSMQPEKIAQTMDGEIITWMKEKSADKMICGTVAVEDAGKYYNRFVACFNGFVVATYDKRHLFSYAGEDKHYTAGETQIIFEYRGWKIKPLVCYDLRFPVWCRNREEADLMIFCANWPAVRINAWNALLPARAIENQCYVLGVNRVGADGNNKRHNGATHLFNPLGISSNNDTETEKCFEYVIEKTEIQKTRNEFPFLKDADEYSILQAKQKK